MILTEAIFGKVVFYGRLRLSKSVPVESRHAVPFYVCLLSMWELATHMIKTL